MYGKTCTVHGNHSEKIGQHFPSICYILHLTCFKINQQISPTLKTHIRSICSSSPMGMGPSSLELPNQLILQTGHRNAEAKTAPWTPNATQRLQVDLLLRPANSTGLVRCTLRCTVNSNGLKSSGLIPILSLIALFGLITSFALSALYAD